MKQSSNDQAQRPGTQDAPPANPDALAGFAAATLLDLHFALNKSQIILSRKKWSNNQDLPDSVEVINIPLEIIEKIKNGEVIKYDGKNITQSSEKELVGVLNVSPWNIHKNETSSAHG